MRIALDTSVALRLLTGEPAESAALAAVAVEAEFARGTQFLMTDLVVAECYFALQHHYRVSKERAIQILSEFFRSSPVRAAGVAASVLETQNLHTARPGFVDRLIHAEATARAEELWTFERADARLAKVRVLGR